MNGKWRLQHFYITNLGRNRVIFGYPWFKAFQPQFDWEEGIIQGKPTIHLTTFDRVVFGPTPIRKQAELNRTTTLIDWQIEANKN